MNADVIILGAGDIGACTALELARRGLRVLIVDPQPVGHGASGNSAAMLETQLDSHRGEPFLSIARLSDSIFPAHHAEVRDRTGVDYDLERCGILQMAVSEDDATTLESFVKYQTGAGFRAEWWSRSDLNGRLPQLGFPHFGGAFYTGDGQVDGRKFLEGTLKLAAALGVQIAAGTGFAALKTEKGRVTGVQTPQRDYEAPCVVLATGAWTDQLLAPLGIRSGMTPIRGQLLIFDTPERPLPHPVYAHRGGYVTPKRGYTLIGTTVEQAGFESKTTDEGREAIQKIARTFLPGFDSRRPLSASAGLRPKSPDDLPLIGPLPGHDNVLLAAGHFRNGVLLAPATGRIVADIATATKPPFDLTAFRPDRVVQPVTPARG